MSKVAILYPGQGSQYIGMGQDFYKNSIRSKEIFDQASELLDLNLAELCFLPNNNLHQTEYTQAALVTTCLAITEEMKTIGLTPVVAAGLSLGEYAAIAATGAMTNMEAIRLVRKRGILMEQAVPDGAGSMSAILGLSGEQVEEVLNTMQGVYIANYNCPGQIVITGVTQAVKEASEKLLLNGARRAVILKVSGPFHSPMLEDAGKLLGDVLEAVQLQPLKIPYVANLTGTYVSSTDGIKELLVRQISSPVRWQQSIETMIEHGVDTFLEIGPGKALSGFIKRISRDVRILNVGTWEEYEQFRREFTKC